MLKSSPARKKYTTRLPIKNIFFITACILGVNQILSVNSRASKGQNLFSDGIYNNKKNLLIDYKFLYSYHNFQYRNELMPVGRESNNQSGNLRWFSPWRGGGSRVPHTYSEKWFFWKPFRIIPWLLKRVLHIVWALYYAYIVVEVTMNMAKYTSSWQSAAGAAEECQYLNQL